MVVVGQDSSSIFIFKIIFFKDWIYRNKCELQAFPHNSHLFFSFSSLEAICHSIEIYMSQSQDLFVFSYYISYNIWEWRLVWWHSIYYLDNPEYQKSICYNNSSPVLRIIIFWGVLGSIFILSVVLLVLLYSCKQDIADITGR